MARESLVSMEQWLTEALNDQDKKLPSDSKTRARCVGFMLMHMVNVQEIEIHSVKFGPETGWSTEEIGRLATLLRGKASTDAQELNGVQHYRLYAFYEGVPTPQARFNFRATGKLLATDADGYGTEEPTSTGRALQKMRVDDALTSTFIVGNREMVNQMMHMCRQLGEQNIALMNRNSEMFNAFQQVAMDRVREERQIRTDDLNALSSAEERKAIFKMLPGLVNTATGTNIFPQEAEDHAFVESIAENMTPERLQALPQLLGILGLSPLATGAIIARLEKTMKKKAAEMAHVRALTKPEDAASGGSELARIETDGEPLQ